MTTDTVARLFDLTGRVALVTGAGGWLGAAMATALAEAGATVLLNGRRPEPLAALAETLRDQGLAAEALAFDVTDAAAVKSGLDTIADRFGRIDALVNNAYAGGAGAIADSPDEAFGAAYERSVTAAFRLVRDGLPLLQAGARAAGDAAIVNVASMYGMVSPDPRLYDRLPPNPPFYGAAKGGLLQLTRYLACWLATDRIRANAISPGPFPNPTVRRDAPDFTAKLEEKTPLGRLGDPTDLKGAVVFLASRASAYVTGTNLPVDGGWTAW